MQRVSARSSRKSGLGRVPRPRNLSLGNARSMKFNKERDIPHSACRSLPCVRLCRQPRHPALRPTSSASIRSPTSAPLRSVQASSGGACRLTDLQPFWQRVRARAGLNDVRIHDLRHTFASTAVASGQALPMIGKLLGHTQVHPTGSDDRSIRAPCLGDRQDRGRRCFCGDCSVIEWLSCLAGGKGAGFKPSLRRRAQACGQFGRSAASVFPFTS